MSTTKKMHNFLVATLALVLTYLLTYLFLATNFSYNGEAYYKGAGHLLRENWWKGLFFIATQELIATTLLFYLLFLVLPARLQQYAFKVFCVISAVVVAMVLLYSGDK